MGSRQCYSRDIGELRNAICSHCLRSVQRVETFGQGLVTFPGRQPRYSFEFCIRHRASLWWTHHVSLKRAALPRALPSTDITPLHRYYDPSDFLDTISPSLPTGLVRRYCTPSQSTQDLPRSPVSFDCMPCPQTPGTSHAATRYRDARYCLLGYLHHRPSRTSNLTGLYHFNPKAYGLQSLCLGLACAVARADPRLDTECGGSPLLRRDFHPLGKQAPRGAQITVPKYRSLALRRSSCPFGA